MINQKFIEVLKILNQKLKNQNIRWVLVGSTSLALQKVKVKPKDIDILTDKEGSFKINKLLKKYEVKHIKFRQTDLYQSYFGEFRINEVKVEIMGNWKKKFEGKWIDVSPRLISPIIIEVQGMILHASPLKEQLASCKALGREKDFTRVPKIKEAIKRADYDEFSRLTPPIMLSQIKLC